MTCSTVLKDVCEVQNTTEIETYTVTECSSFYLFMDEEECEYHWEGEGDSKKWVVMPGSCRRQRQPDPQDECSDVTREREKMVPRTVCREEEEECVEELREECHQVTNEVCSEPEKDDDDDDENDEEDDDDDNDDSDEKKSSSEESDEDDDDESKEKHKKHKKHNKN